MAAGRIIIPNYMPALDLNGGPVAGAKITFYLSKTTTLAPTYTDASLSTPHPNPVVANADGVFPSIFADTLAYFSVAITGPDDTPIGGLRNIDNIQAAESVNGKLDQSANLADVDSPSEARANLSLNEVSPLEYGGAGDGVADDTAAIIAALASGRTVNLRGLTYKVSAVIAVASGKRLHGPGRLVPTSAFNGSWVVRVDAGSNTEVRGVTIDGTSLLNASVVFGIRINGSTTDLLVQDCTVKNMTFTGIDVSGGAGSFTHIRPQVLGCRVINTAWTGINMERATAGQIKGCSVDQTGYHGIAINAQSTDCRVSENFITKATAPSRIYNGAGSLGGVEGGFMITYDETVDRLVIDSNICDDNRTAAFDGIGVGEDGTEFGSVVISNNIVRRAGLFGIDPTGNCVCVGNWIEAAAEQGIHVGLDLGGIIRNVVVSGNVIRNTGDVAGKSGILVGDTLGALVTMSNVKIADNIVVDDRATKYTAYGVTIVSDEATYTGLSITGNDLARVATGSLNFVGTAGPGLDFQCWGNNVIGDERLSYTPATTAQTGTITTQSSSGRYQRHGKLVEFRARVTITTAGTGAGQLIIPLPVPARAGTSFPMTVMAGNSAQPLFALTSGNNLLVTGAGGGTVIANGADIFVSGSYEAA